MKRIQIIILLSGMAFSQTVNKFIPLGGVNSQTTNYTAVAADVGKIIQMNCSSCTLTLPATPPYSQWSIFVQNLNASTLTISRNGLTIDGAGSNLSLSQTQGIFITTNGTNYFTSRGTGGTAAVGAGVANQIPIYNSTTSIIGDSALTDVSNVLAYAGNVASVGGAATFALGAGANSPAIYSDYASNNQDLYLRAGNSGLNGGTIYAGATSVFPNNVFIRAFRTSGIGGAISLDSAGAGGAIEICANGGTNCVVRFMGTGGGIGMGANGNLLISNTAPTIAGAGCGGSAASIATNNGTAAFSINVGSTPTTACTVTLPAAPNAWNCYATDITTQSTSIFLQKQTATGTTTATITNYNTAGSATNLVASDIIQVSCFGR